MKKVAVITGGTSGLGLQIVKGLLNEKYKVYSISRSIDKIEKIREEFPEVEFICGDVSKHYVIEGLARKIEEQEKKIDVLINNAGIIFAGGIETLSYEEWNEMFNVNVGAIFSCVKILLPLIKKGTNSSIINISSISSKMTGSSMAYSACKASVDMITKSLAKELAKYNIRVNSVNPGIINTGFQVHNNLIGESDYPKFLNDISETYPLGVGEASDVYNLICFLISDKAKWITGSNYIIDGGRSVNI